MRPSIRRGHRLLDHHLGAGVEAGRGLVEDEDRGVGQGGPGQRDQLLLPRREAGAALAHLGVEALGQQREALPHADGVEGRHHLAVGGAGAGEADVLEDRAVEQEPLLGHDDDPLAQRPLGGVAQVDAGVADGPSVGS